SNAALWLACFEHECAGAFAETVQAVREPRSLVNGCREYDRRTRETSHTSSQSRFCLLKRRGQGERFPEALYGGIQIADCDEHLADAFILGRGRLARRIHPLVARCEVVNQEREERAIRSRANRRSLPFDLHTIGTSATRAARSMRGYA